MNQILIQVDPNLKPPPGYNGITYSNIPGYPSIKFWVVDKNIDTEIWLKTNNKYQNYPGETGISDIFAYVSPISSRTGEYSGLLPFGYGTPIGDFLGKLFEKIFGKGWEIYLLIIIGLLIISHFKK